MRALLVAVSVLLATPAVTEAATVYWQDESARARAEVLFLADPGERNDVAVRPDGQNFVRISDAGAPLRTGGACAAIAANEVRCPRAQFSASLEDGDDRIDLGTLPGFVHGGPGDDTIRGSTGADLLHGDDGRDVIDGAESDDEVAGDGLTPGADRLSGGPGSDWIDYTTHPVGVAVTLSQEPVGVGDGAEDLADGFENVSGTFHDDLLVGDDAPNRISAGGGIENHVEAKAGDDVVTMLGGFARLGDGDDVVVSAGPKSGIECGPGSDQVTGRRLFDLLYPDCEIWRLFLGSRGKPVPVPVAPELRGGSAIVRLRCPSDRGAGRCRGTIVLSRPGRRGREIGRRAVAADRGHLVSAAFRLSRGQRKLTRRRSGLGVCVKLRLKYSRDPAKPEWDGYCTVLRAR